MAGLPDKAFDLAIVDPPYGIGWDGENLCMSLGLRKDGSKRHDPSWLAKKGIQKYERKSWDNAPPKEYFDELERISKKRIIWGGNNFDLKPSSSWIVWDKKKPENWSMSDCELAWVSFGGSVKIFRFLWHGYGKESPETRIHPTQKPVKLYEWLLRNYAKPGQRILDTHGGSMSIAIACHNLGYDLTLCELDEGYYKAGVKRFEQHKAQGSLFIPDTPKDAYKQTDLLY